MIFRVASGSDAGGFRLCGIPFVFSPGGHSAADVPLRLVQLQNLPNLYIQRLVYLRQPLGQILVYGGFGNMESLRGGSDGGSGLNHVCSQIAGPLLDRISHKRPSL